MLQHKPLILKNYMVSTLVDLLGVPLQANAARARNRFIKLFSEIVKPLEEERQALLKKYGDLDEKGNLKIGADSHYVMKDKAAFTKEFEAVTQRDLAVTCVGDQFSDFLQVKHALETLETKLNVEQTTVYDAIMQAFDDWARSEGAMPLADEGFVAS